MKKLAKKMGTILLVGSLLVSQIQGGIISNAASSDEDNTEICEAYTDYYWEHYGNNSKYMEPAHGTLDINNDSIDEMYVTYAYGVRTGYDFLYYKDGKVVKLKSFKGCNLVRYKKSLKQICVVQSSGAASTSYTTYKFTGSKLKKVNSYSSDGKYTDDFKLKMVYYKNKKRISKATYNKAVKKLNKWTAVY